MTYYLIAGRQTYFAEPYPLYVGHRIESETIGDLMHQLNKFTNHTHAMIFEDDEWPIFGSGILPKKLLKVYSANGWQDVDIQPKHWNDIWNAMADKD